jgi:hypothetical protein
VSFLELGGKRDVGTSPGWAPDPLMVGIRSPDGLVVGSCTSHPGVLGSIPKCVMGRLVHTGLGS